MKRLKKGNYLYPASVKHQLPRGLIVGIIAQAFRDAKLGDIVGEEARVWIRENATDWATIAGISIPAGWEKYVGN